MSTTTTLTESCDRLQSFSLTKCNVSHEILPLWEFMRLTEVQLTLALL